MARREGWPRYYILVDRVPFAVDMMTWARSYDNFEKTRRVAEDRVGDAWVSTVFLGLDHNYFDEGEPILFETLVFGGPMDDEMRRYSTYAEAERGHAEVLAQVKIAAARIKALADAAGADTGGK